MNAFTKSLLATTALVLAGSGAMAGEVRFTPVPFAADDAQKRAVLASTGVEINGQTYPIGFSLLAATGVLRILRNALRLRGIDDFDEGGDDPGDRQGDGRAHLVGG